ncbi:MAG TPA: DUF1549 and DUF1553 domain-containing protein [Gemmata sp.]|nr:DUF1549 and DUF1553 domain-containing protein [Gemmata sp.]
MPRSLVIVALLAVAPPLLRGQDKYTDPVITEDDRKQWAYQPPVRPATEGKANPIDQLVRTQLTKAKLSQSPEADRLTLIRRVTLDLTGLPPTPKEVESFLHDSAADAYQKLVDRLLVSPHFGERWAQHWLDVVRFAETNGFELDADRPHAWRYRDYVISAFNTDKPYDQFLTEQLAGDELAAAKDPRSTADLWIATGMHRCAPVHMVSGNLDKDELRQEQLTEMVNGVGAAFLGMTVGCARCHDHKFDPFSAGDYYRLQAFFAPATYVDIDISTPAERDARKKAADTLNARIAPIKAQLNAIDAPYRDRIARAKLDGLEQMYKDALAVPAERRTPEQKRLAAEAGPMLKVTWDEVVDALTPADREKRSALRERYHALAARMPPPPAAAWAIKVTEPKAATHVLKRGSVQRKSLAVSPGYPRVLVNAHAEPKSRLELARWMTRPDHPLTARVIVNRLWQHHIGRGIVATPNDFGLRGEKPTHPELLDWLATELVANKWSLKHIHRLIVTSATYKQEAATDHGAATDPDNKLLWRMNRRRLEAEAVRDSVLAAAGTLNPQVGGRSVRVPLEPEVYDLIFTEGEPDGLWPVTPDPKQHTRRSIYLFSKRNVRLPLLESLDQPDTLNSCAFRPVSIYAPQALILMNGPFAQEQGKALAITLAKEHKGAAEQVEGLYRRALGRAPRPDELKLAIEFLDVQSRTIRDAVRDGRAIGLDATRLPQGVEAARVRALADLCVVVFNTHEFVYIP